MSYEETTKITGGSALSMMKFAGAFSKDARKFDKPIVTSVAVKDNRMARVSEDSSEIIDLDAETVTKIDKIKHEYSVVTFTQMKEAMERAVANAKAEQAKAEQAKPKDPQPSTPSNVELGFEAHARKTGATKQVSGIDTSEIILTLAMNGKDKTNGQQGAMAITNDMWMAPDLPGYSEVREFNRKLAAKIGSMASTGPDVSALVKQAAASDAMNSLGKEIAEVKGVPVLQVMRMGITANGQPLPAASEAPLPAGNSDSGNPFGAAVAKSATDVAQQTAAQEMSSRVRGALGSSLGSAIGGFGGFGRKKKAAPQDPPAAPPSAAPASAASSAGQSQTSAVLIESVTEIGKFSQQVDPAVMQVPAGYKLVPAPELNNTAH